MCRLSLSLARYEKCPQITDVARAADKYVSIVFAVNTQQPDSMSFQEFRSIVLMQPQIATFLHIVDVSVEWDWLRDMIAGPKIVRIPLRRRRR